LARAQTTLYRAVKFVRRRWLPVSGAAVFALGLSFAAIVTVRQTQAVRAEAQKAEKVVDFLSNMLSSGTRAGAGYTVAQMLDAAESELARNWHDDPLTEARLRMNLGASYCSLQQPDRARSQTQRALLLYRQQGDYRGAAIALWILGQNAESIDSLSQAASFYGEAKESLLRLGKRNIPQLWDLRVERDLARALARLSSRHWEKARTLLETALARAAGDTNIPLLDIVMARGSLGQVLVDEGKELEAEAAFQQAMSDCHRTNTDSNCEPVLHGRMRLMARNGDLAAAVEFARQRYQLVVKDYGVDNLWVVRCQLDWARYRAEAGEKAEALAQVQEAMQVLSRHPLNESRWSPLLAASHVLATAGHFEEAERYARESLQVVNATHRDEVDPGRAESLELIGTALSGEKKYGEAVPVLERARDIYAQLGPAFGKSTELVRGLLREAQEKAR
jgi:tetratricopeptide (TPR) repeat protein